MARSIKQKDQQREFERVAMAYATATGHFLVPMERRRADTPHERLEVLEVYRLTCLTVSTAIEVLQRALDGNTLERKLAPVLHKFLEQWRAKVGKV